MSTRLRPNAVDNYTTDWSRSAQIFCLEKSLLMMSCVGHLCAVSRIRAGKDQLVWEFGCLGIMATHSSILTWEIPWMEEPGGLIVHRILKGN